MEPTEAVMGVSVAVAELGSFDFVPPIVSKVSPAWVLATARQARFVN